jgi:hypothetical protein
MAASEAGALRRCALRISATGQCLFRRFPIVSMIAFVDTSTSRAASHQPAESANQGITTRRRSPEGDHAPRPDAPVDLDRQTFLGPFVRDRQTLQLLAVRGRSAGPPQISVASAWVEFRCCQSPGTSTDFSIRRSSLQLARLIQFLKAAHCVDHRLPELSCATGTGQLVRY